MKIVIYNLNADGTVPEYIIDGGYFATPNNNLSPQDLDLVGSALDTAQQNGFVDQNELLTYAESKNFVFTDPITEEVIPLEIVVESIWFNLNNGNN